MKSKIFLYLFLFSLLMLLFLYMSQKSIYESQDNTISGLHKQLEKSQDSILKLNSKIEESNYFNLQGNDNAMTYFENMGYEAAGIENLISNHIYDQNTISGNNPLVPFEGMEGDMKINKLKFINHKWILADFTDGAYWGEMILEYYINDQDQIKLNTIASTLYNK